MELKKVINTRRSCRAYTDGAVPQQAIDDILAAANAAPVGMGAYDSVRLTVIRSKDFLAGLSRAAAAFMKRDGDPIYGVQTIILVSAKPGPIPGIEQANTGAIMENMMLTATENGLGCVYLMGAMAALRGAPELVARLNLPEGFVPVAGMGVGIPAEPLKEREPVKKIALDYLD